MRRSRASAVVKGKVGLDHNFGQFVLIIIIGGIIPTTPHFAEMIWI